MAQDPARWGFVSSRTSRQLAVYGLQKLHAAARGEGDQRGQDAQAPAIGVLGVEGNVAKNPPVISREGTGLEVVDDGGARAGGRFRRGRRNSDRLRRERRLGRELQLVSADGQSNNAISGSSWRGG